MNTSDVTADDRLDDEPSRPRRTRRLRRQLRKEKQGELNIVSMIDVFAVLVFFMLVSSSIAAARFNTVALNLPSLAHTATPDEARVHPSIQLLPDALLVTADQRPALHLRNTPQGYDLAALAEALQALKREAPAQVRIDVLVSPDVAYEDLIAVMDVARTGSQKLTLPAAELFSEVALGDLPAGSSQP